MKKVLFTVFSGLILSVVTLSAQGVFGLKGGLNISNLTNADQIYGDDDKTKISFNAGGFYRHDLSEKIQIQPELLLSLQGDKAKNGDLVGRTNLTYINLPVMFRYLASENFAIEVGPQVGYLATASSVIKDDGDDVLDEDIKDDLQSIDFAANFGLAYELPSGLGFNARYSLGLTDIIKDNNGDELKNSVFQIGLTYVLSK